MPPTRLHTYLETIGITAVLEERAQQLLSLYLAFPDVEPAAFFLSEYPEDDGTRVYQALWLFSRNSAMEAKWPGAGDEHIDFVPLHKAVRHLIVETRAYDMLAATEASRMRVEAWFSDTRVGEMRASGTNCDELKRIVQDYLLPNLAPLSAA